MMKVLNPTLLLLLIQQSIVSNAEGCPPSPGWFPLGEYCYLLSPTKMTFWEADQFCNDNRGWLAEIFSAEEQSKINEVLMQEDWFWIGLTDLAFEGQFEWHHSYKALGSWTNWRATEPNG